MNVWLLLLTMVLTFGGLAALWVMVQFALISDDTRGEIYGKEICRKKARGPDRP